MTLHQTIRYLSGEKSDEVILWVNGLNSMYGSKTVRMQLNGLQRLDTGWVDQALDLLQQEPGFFQHHGWSPYHMIMHHGESSVVILRKLHQQSRTCFQEYKNIL